MELYYINSDGQKLDFTDFPYLAKNIDNLINYGWGYVTQNERVKSFYKDVTEIPIEINIHDEDRTEFEKAANHFHDVIEKDVVENKKGKLYLNGQYISGYFKESRKKDWCKTVPFYVASLMFLVEKISWIEEQQISLQPISEARSAEENKTYPYTYPYRYGNTSKTANFKIDHYAASDFRMIVYGPTANISITINGHIYHVEYPIEDGEYMVIDSRSFLPPDERIYVVRQNGEKVNVFNYRDPDHSIFEKIPAGDITIDYSRKYGIDLIIFKERSEPKWKDK